MKRLRPLTPEEFSENFDNQSWTLSYSPEQGGFWKSFHDYYPDHMRSTRGEVFSFKGNKMYLHNMAGVFAKYYEQEAFPTLIDVVFNEHPGMAKVFQSVNWISEIINDQGVSLFDKTLTAILCYNSYQCSGQIDLVTLENVRNSDGTWNFNSMRDLIDDRTLPFLNKKLELISDNISNEKPWHDQRRFSDKYLIVRLLLDNIDQNTLYLYDTGTKFRLSAR
jgi:hypothetical protein